TVLLDELRSNWVPGAMLLYVGKGDGAKGLKQRIQQLIQFGMGKNIGHWGGRMLWQLADHPQLMVRWKPTGKEDPDQVKKRTLDRFESAHHSLPFANLQD